MLKSKTVATSFGEQKLQVQGVPISTIFPFGHHSNPFGSELTNPEHLEMPVSTPFDKLCEFAALFLEHSIDQQSEISVS